MKEEKVKTIFSSIAKKYDRANTVFTLGMDQRWRRKLVKMSCVSKDAHVLDCASGTGAVAKKFLKVLGPQGKVIGVDFCKEMIEQVPFKDSRCSFQIEDILNLSFEDQSFDVVSIAYGLRNLSDTQKGLKEMARVTKNDGFVMILETGRPKNLLMKLFVDLYCWIIMPILGWITTGDLKAYQYLNRTSFSFPSGKQMVEKIKQTNCFGDVSYHSLMFGASFIYKAQVKHS